MCEFAGCKVAFRFRCEMGLVNQDIPITNWSGCYSKETKFNFDFRSPGRAHAQDD